MNQSIASKITFIFCISLLISSCRSSEKPLDDGFMLKLDQTITIDGLERNYHIQTPGNATNKPLVIVLHGHSGSSTQSIGQTISKSPQKLWLTLAEREEIIVIVPNGELGSEETRGWNDCRDDALGNPETNDVAFIVQLLDQLKTELDYDENRVYVTGVSNGGGMCVRLAQEIPDRLAAFGAIVTNMPINSKCMDSSVPISALFMNGTTDKITPYEGGQIQGNRGLVQSTDESIEYWIQRNDTDTEATTEILEDINTTDNSSIEKFLYSNGTDNTEVVLYKMVGAGHAEPSLLEIYADFYQDIVGGQNNDIEMVDVVWDFFKDKSN